MLEPPPTFPPLALPLVVRPDGCYIDWLGKLVPLDPADRIKPPKTRAKRPPGNVEVTDQTVRRIVVAVARRHRIRVHDLLNAWTPQRPRHARQIAMYIARHDVGLSMPELGRIFGRHHTSVIAAVRMVERRMADPADNTREMVAAIRARLGG